MTLGQKIKKLRIEKGLTQKDLAEQVHVTFQTISKWEKDENEPDVSTLRELAKLFDCSMNYLLSEDEKEEVKEETKEEPVTKTIIIHQKELHVCSRCGKDIPENELATRQTYVTQRQGPSSRKVPAGQEYYHKTCLEELNKENAAAERRIKSIKTARSKKLSFGWGIAGGIVALIVVLIVLLVDPACKATIHPAVAVLLSLVAGYGIFAMLYCIISGSYIGEVFVWCAGTSIKFPGIIFSWDLDGFLWAIAMKVTLAILSFILGVFILLFAIGLCSTLSIFSFPFILVHNNRTGYADAF